MHLCREVIETQKKKIRMFEERLSKLEDYISRESRFKDEEETRMREYLKRWKARLPQLTQTWRLQDQELKEREKSLKEKWGKLQSTKEIKAIFDQCASTSKYLTPICKPEELTINMKCTRSSGPGFLTCRTGPLTCKKGWTIEVTLVKGYGFADTWGNTYINVMVDQLTLEQ